MQTDTLRPNDNLNDKSKQTGADLRDGARRIREDVREAAGTVKHDLEDIARQAGRQAREFAGSAEKNVTDMADTMTARIQENPLQSSMIALGVGVLLGLSLFRR